MRAIFTSRLNNGNVTIVKPKSVECHDREAEECVELKFPVQPTWPGDSIHCP